MSNTSRVLGTGTALISQGFSSSHGGNDIIKYPGQTDSIIAHSDGTVVFCQTGQGNNKGSGGDLSYGNCVKLKHSNGYYTLYAHMASVDVRMGQAVKRGQRIGYMGDTGNSYGAHLHFEVRTPGDSRIDPAPYINANLPGTSSAPASSSYGTGEYIVTAELLHVRKGAGTNYDAKKYTELTKNAQEQIKKLTGKAYDGLVKGVITDVTKVSGEWGQTASGWINMRYLSKTSAKSVDELAREVIAGKWGSGSDRTNRLKAAGYDSAAVQSRVNQLMS